MNNQIKSIEEAISATKFSEHNCQCRLLLKECAELLASVHTELGGLHYSVYQDDEIEDENLQYHEDFQALMDEGLEMIEKLKLLKILDSER